jgi:hypothetical protein
MSIVIVISMPGCIASILPRAVDFQIARVREHYCNLSNLYHLYAARASTYSEPAIVTSLGTAPGDVMHT